MKYFSLFFAFFALFLAGCAAEKIEVSGETKPLSLNQAQNFEGVVFEEFTDVQCPYCKNLHPVIDQLKKSLPQVEFRLNHFPLEAIHPHAYPAALSIECVGNINNAQKDAYISDIFAAKNLSTSVFSSLAAKNGVDKAVFSDCLKQQKSSSIVKSHMSEAKARGIQGTPTLYVNGEIYSGPRSYDAMYAFLQKKMEEKGL